MKTLRPHPHRLFAALSLGLLCSASFGYDSGLGPRVLFSRQGALVCASYTLDGRHDLYRDHVFARSGPVRIPISNLPIGAPGPGAPDLLLTQSFKACAKAPDPSAALQWIDQSCLRAEGLCLPPRAFEIKASGQAQSLEGSVASNLFSSSIADSLPQQKNKPSSEGWGSIVFKPK